MTKLVMRREGTRLTCPTNDWAEMLIQLPENVDLNVSATRARSIPQLGTYWASLAFALQHGPEWVAKQWLTKDELSDALQLEVGFVNQIKLGNGMLYAVPKSKSFSECPQEVFNAYFSAASDQLARWCDFDVVRAYLDHMRMHGRRAA